MTLLPVERVRVSLPDPSGWPAPDFGLLCAVPGCPEYGTEKHHIVRRSETAGPKSIVAIDGLVVTNLCLLCTRHHRDVTGGVGGHKAWIRWIDRWVWFEMTAQGWRERGTLQGIHQGGDDG